jgi:hypothetical protein
LKYSFAKPVFRSVVWILANQSYNLLAENHGHGRTYRVSLRQARSEPLANV